MGIIHERDWRIKAFMKTKKKVVVALLLAVVLLSVAAISACTPGTNGGGGGAKYTVTFDFNDGNSRPLLKKVIKESAVEEAPSTPLATGYSFTGWFTAKEGGNSITFPYTPNADVTLYAHWEPGVHTVSFNYNYDGAPAAATENIAYMQTVDKPVEDPVRVDYSFRNWFTAPTGGSAVKFPYTVKKDVTFYAQWISNDTVRYMVHFDANYENAPEIDSAEYIENIQSVNMPATPTRSGYAFTGWYENEEGGEAVGFPYVPAAETTLYAHWAVAEYTLTLKRNYGAPDDSNINVLSISGATETPAPNIPVRDGYTFAGWWTNARGGSEIVFPVTISRTSTYYAHWTADPLTTNIFHAEYVSFNLTKLYNGYSGSVTGSAAIDPDSDGSLKTLVDENNYVLEDVGVPKYVGYYVTYQYMQNDTLEFNIYSDKQVTNATLSACLAGEIKHFTIAPETNAATATFSYLFKVNGTSMNYNPITFSDYEEGSSAKGKFTEYTISQISLNAGWNTITLVTNNATNYMGGTMLAAAPMIDYIRISNTDAVLSWVPVYENLGYL